MLEEKCSAKLAVVKSVVEKPNWFISGVIASRPLNPISNCFSDGIVKPYSSGISNSSTSKLIKI